MRYLLLDRIDEMERGRYALGIKCVTRTEDCFEHHFPGQPVYPGALLIECMAQLAGALLEVSARDTGGGRPRCVLSKVTSRFREFVRPGDMLTVRADIRSSREESALVDATIHRGGTRVTEAEMLFTFLEVDHPRLQESREDYLEQLTERTRFVV